ncbi:MAG: DUF5615 family PIN-like protein [Microcoleus sp.]|uniref:DUF5615 domain-containing protein n=1 Tax=Tychonema bourrellyi FEM_GT703 TaxID=2040638 RepID=A0A2G4F417_9CYAN|nr:DUF5615 family PIN-like protein [Tychonema bourrellyi]MDQ2100887.1 DUF5615 family PIN-like protein [Tychonema bourrellyi B0820]PHX56227.1 hypothetical protein CP500_006595 [Tychonema bourrellyi FEM_GT703]
MSNIRLYFDEDIMEKALVQALRVRDIDVMTVGETGRVGESDEAQLIWATVQGRVLYSSNIGDFCRLHNDFIAEGKSHAGIILVSQQRYSVGVKLQGILRLVGNNSAEDMVNQLEFFSKYLRD